MKQQLFNHIKNIPGWKTKRKLVVISVDDYGNVRLDSKTARANMDKAGLKVSTRFDAYDTLENKQDLEALFEALTSVKDKNGNPAVFTPFALPCNIDFETMATNHYEFYAYELLPETYKKLSNNDPKAYEGAWELWQEGIAKGILRPQFHGREHLNLKVFEEKLQQKDEVLLTALKNRSYTSQSPSGYSSIGYTAAFSFWNFEENLRFREIMRDGFQKFESVYGYASIHFNPPGGREHTCVHDYLKENGVRCIDVPLIKTEHQGNGKYKKSVHWTGQKNNLGQTYMVRNAVFEPTDNSGKNWVDFTMKQVEIAFFWNRPAVISSHRVNFCGHIDEKNRAVGIGALKTLLAKIVAQWPDVEFVSSEQLIHIMEGTTEHPNY
jgi:hypothetical protein